MYMYDYVGTMYNLWSINIGAHPPVHVGDVLAQQAGKLGVYAVFAYTIYPSHPLYILIFPSVGTPCCKVYAWSILDATKMPPGN